MTPAKPSSNSDPRTPFEIEIDIAAPVADVWRALTEAEELTRWFPLAARVKPGVGGTVFLSWGPACEGEAPITLWEPNRRLQVTEQTPDPAGGPSPVPLVIDYFLESRGATTRLRLVHSGFTRDASWDGYYDSISRGWKFELRGLRHYLERHRGLQRDVIWVRQHIGACDAAEAAARVLGGDGQVYRGELAALREGDAYRLAPVAAGVPELSGRVQVNGLPRSFAATVEGLNSAYLRWEIEHYEGAVQAWLWLSTFGVDATTRTSVESAWQEALRRAFG